MTSTFLHKSSMISCLGVMIKVFGLQLGPNFEVWLATDNKFYLRLTVEKMCAFAVFTK